MAPAAFSFNPNDLHRLNRLVFAAPRGSAIEQSAGGHRLRRVGESNEFLDFRPYVPGDDFRKVDWNLYARLRQVFVRLNEASGQLRITLLVDASRSMGFGEPVSKLVQAQRIACGLGYIALRGADRVHVAHFSEGISAQLGPLMGRRALGAMVRHFAGAKAQGKSDLVRAVQQCGPRRGLFVILSDFLNVHDWESALGRILAHRAGILAIQVLDPLDTGAGLSGHLRLRDSETGRMVDVHVDPARLAEFQQSFEERRAALEHFCVSRGQYYLRASTTDNYLQLICHALRSQAVLR